MKLLPDEVRPLKAMAHGHEGSLLQGRPGMVLKASSPSEVAAYKLLKDTNDPLLEFLPVYYGEVEVEGHDSVFMLLEDVLYDFNNPHVMDIKMGKRTFLESECANMKLREDLFQKMVKLSPDLPTDEERRQSAVTKLRYMTVREQLSSSASLGFRVDGIVHPERLSGSTKWDRLEGLGKIQTRAQVLDTFRGFIDEVLRDARDEDDVDTATLQHDVTSSIIQQLRHLEHLLQKSPFFASHEMVGCSLLFAVESSGKVVVKLIDLAKCQRLPVGVTVDHRANWVQGNYEDGWLCGLEKLQEVWMDLCY